MNPGSYALATATFVAATDTALEADVTGLTPDTRYYYRTRYRLNGTTTAFQAGPEHPYSVCYFDRHSWELQPGMRREQLPLKWWKLSWTTSSGFSRFVPN